MVVTFYLLVRFLFWKHSYSFICWQVFSRVCRKITNEFCFIYSSGRCRSVLHCCGCCGVRRVDSNCRIKCIGVSLEAQGGGAVFCWRRMLHCGWNRVYLLGVNSVELSVHGSTIWLSVASCACGFVLRVISGCKTWSVWNLLSLVDGFSAQDFSKRTIGTSQGQPSCCGQGFLFNLLSMCTGLRYYLLFLVSWWWH